MAEKDKYVHIGRVGKFLSSVGNLAVNVRELDGRLTSISDDAYKRIMSAGKEEIGRTFGTRVSMTVNYLKGEPPVLVKRERFPLELAKKIVNANIKGDYYCIDSDEQYELVRETAAREEHQGIAPSQRTAMVCPVQTQFRMSPDENKQHYEFVFEDTAYETDRRTSYFELNQGPITFHPIDSRVVHLTDGTTLNYIWFASLERKSELDGMSRCHYDDGNLARGMLMKSKQSPKRNSVSLRLEARILEALNNGEEFTYNGVLYIPADKNAPSD